MLLVSETFSSEQVLAHLAVRHLPRSVAWYERITSTMDLARQAVTQPQSFTQFPMLIGADDQTAGRGRLGRRWNASPGSALLCSLAWRQPSWLRPGHSYLATQLVAVSLAQAICETTGQQTAGIKWPNDVVIQQADGSFAKVAGILQETAVLHGALAWLVIGFGVNIHAAPPPTETRMPATSVNAQAQQPIDRLAFLRAALLHMDRWYDLLLQGKQTELFSAWQTALVTLGREVRVECGDRVVTGLAQCVDADGTLCIQASDGTVERIRTGDVGA